MLSIRLSRFGKKKQPIYRVIVTDRQRDPWGKYLDNLGFYNPKSKISEIKADRVTYWISQGAQATATVHNLLVSKGIIKAKTVRAGKSKLGKKKQAAAALLKAEADKKIADEAKAKAEAVKAEAEAKVAEEAAKAEAEKPAEPVVETTPTEPAV